MTDDQGPERKIKVTFNFENLGAGSKVINPSDLSKGEPAQNNSGSVLTDDALVVDFSKLSNFDSEKRKLPRIKYWGPIVLHGKSKPFAAQAVANDINLKGIGVSTSTDQAVVGTEVIVEFKGSSSLKPFSIECVVVRVFTSEGKNCVGLQVTKMGRLAEANIKEYIDNYDESDVYGG